MLVSERFVLPLAQFAKVPYWLLAYYLVMLSPNKRFWSFLDLYAGIFIIAAAELIAGVVGLFPKSASLKFIFVIMMWTWAVGIPVFPQLFIVSLQQESGILFIVLIEVITSVEFLVLRNKSVREWYHTRV